MALKIGINGFGRIGRMVLRSIIENDRKDLEIVAINNRGNSEVSSFLLKRDTIHGNLKAKIRFNDKGNLDGTTQEYYGNGNKKFSVRMNNGLVRDGYMYTRSGDRRKMNAEDYDKLGLK